MRRREFITLLGGAAATWPRVARAQLPGRLPTIGFLGAYTDDIQREWTAAFVQRLRELGWSEGRTIAIEYRWAEGREDRFGEFAAEFVRLNVMLIVTGGTAPALAAKAATSKIPVVFATAADPLGTGLVSSLARPGGNVTGFSLQWTDIAGKRVELLREILPGLTRLAIMANIGAPGAMLEMAEAQSAAGLVGLEAVSINIRQSQDIPLEIAKIKDRANALYVCGDPLLNTYRADINSAALAAQLPTMYGAREYVEAGGLVSYGANFADLYRRAGDHVDKILRGAKAGDIPVEQPTKFEFIINLKTAKALGLSVPLSLLGRADEVIE
jgi:putative ABC transport system substrate-binding protein